MRMNSHSNPVQADEPDVNRCGYCNKRFSTKHYLTVHRKIHLNQKDFKCTLCTYSTVHQLSLEKHIRTHTGEKPYKCPHPNCSYAAARNSHLKSHQLTHNKGDPSLLKLRCPVPNCGHKTARKQHLNRHLKTHSAKEREKALQTQQQLIRKKKTLPQYPCSVADCSFTTTFKSRLNEHLRTHSDFKPFSCDICSYRSKEKRSLAVHQQLIHNKGDKKLPEFRCSVPGCPFKTPNKSQFDYHLLTHSGVKPFVCDLCPYRGKTKRAVKIHQDHVHSTEKPFKCPQPNCQYSGKGHSNLSQHLKTHSDERPFVCSFPECNYRSKTKLPLRNHERIHSGEKPYKCPYCPHSCSRQDSLVKHIRVHTKETPYSCNICIFQTKTSWNLKTHVKRMHSDKRSNRSSLLEDLSA